ncbi:MAG: hypothetical protein AUI83_09895 [Armatimonadetes bacterium 13_1_40CM_3_65_7]|nr:MAG: hypothetical protein AUI83_09895 [Armatimonadetes bacterium 13_1_40CM_3_65_7]
MKKQTKFIHIILGTLIVVALAVGVGYGATATGSQTVTITAADAIEITVPGTASITANAGVAGGCGTASTSITVKRKNASSVFLTNAFQWGTDGSTYGNITTAYADAFTSQAKTGNAGVSKTVYYKQCVTYDDDPADYTIVAEYQGSN